MVYLKNKVKRKSEKSFSRLLDSRIPVEEQNGFKGHLRASKGIQRIPVKEGRNISAKAEIKIDSIRESDICDSRKKIVEKIA